MVSLLEQESAPQEQHDHKKTVEKTVSGLAATQSAQVSTQQAAIEYSKPAGYDRSLLEDQRAMNAAKTRAFEGKKAVKDPYTGKKLVQSEKEAQQLYGDKWAEHAAETDHVKPLKSVWEDEHERKWVKTEDIKARANSDENFEMLSKKTNTSKNQKTTDQYIEKIKSEADAPLTEAREKNVREMAKRADKAISRGLRHDTIRNIGTTFHKAGVQGAKSAGASTITTVGIMNLVAVIKGEKEAGDAILETVEAGGKAAATGYAMSGGLTIVSHTLSDSSSKLIQGLMKSNVPGKVITAVMVTGDTLRRYANGEIDTQDCLIELGEKGLTTISSGYGMMVGTAVGEQIAAAIGQTAIPIPIVGAAIGAFVGAALTGGLHHELIGQLREKELEAQQRQLIIEECERAAAQERAYRAELEKYLDGYFADCRDCFDSALMKIKASFQDGDADGMIAGANQITRKLGGAPLFETVDEFVERLASGGPVF